MQTWFRLTRFILFVIEFSASLQLLCASSFTLCKLRCLFRVTPCQKPKCYEYMHYLFTYYFSGLKVKQPLIANNIQGKNVKQIYAQGFTLIEVLIALAIIAISLTALLQSISQSILTTQRIQDKTVSHFVATQGVTLVQLGLLPLTHGSTQMTEMFNQRWYWRIESTPSPIKKVKVLTVLVSKKQAGPFQEALKAFYYEQN